MPIRRTIELRVAPTQSGSPGGILWEKWYCVVPMFVAALLVVPTTAQADTQRPSGLGEDINYEYGVDYNGLDIMRPINNFETRFEYRTSRTSTQTDEQTLTLRRDGAAKLTGGVPADDKRLARLRRPWPCAFLRLARASPAGNP